MKTGCSLYEYLSGLKENAGDTYKLEIKNADKAVFNNVLFMVNLSWFKVNFEEFQN
jgi:hypothetical protein